MVMKRKHLKTGLNPYGSSWMEQDDTELLKGRSFIVLKKGGAWMVQSVKRPTQLRS